MPVFGYDVCLAINNSDFVAERTSSLFGLQERMTLRWIKLD